MERREADDFDSCWRQIGLKPGRKLRHRILSSDGLPKFWNFRLLRNANVDVIVSPVHETGFSDYMDFAGGFVRWNKKEVQEGLPDGGIYRDKLSSLVYFNKFTTKRLNTVDPEVDLRQQSMNQYFFVKSCGFNSIGVDIYILAGKEGVIDGLQYNTEAFFDEKVVGNARGPYQYFEGNFFRQDAEERTSFAEFSVDSQTGGEIYYSAANKIIINGGAVDAEVADGICVPPEGEGFDAEIFGYKLPLFANKISRVTGYFANRIGGAGGAGKIEDISSYQGFSTKGIFNTLSDFGAAHLGYLFNQDVPQTRLFMTENMSFLNFVGDIFSEEEEFFANPGPIFNYLNFLEILNPGQLMIFRPFENNQSLDFLSPPAEPGTNTVVLPADIVNVEIEHEWSRSKSL